MKLSGSSTISMSSTLDIELRKGAVLLMNLLEKPLALFYDATRARVLDVLLANPQALSGRAIARQSDLSPTTTNLALGDLASHGIVSSRADGRSHLWSLCWENALVKQLVDLARVHDEHAGQILADALGSEPLSVTLFGSIARGESGPHSDVDILVIAKDHAQGQNFRRRAYRASSARRQEVGREVEITIIESDALQEPSIQGFLGQVLSDGRTLHGKKLSELVS